MDRWKDYGRHIRTTLSLSTVGLELALSVGLGYLVGDWLDGRLATTPYLMIVFVLTGATAGFVSLYRTLKRHAGREDE